MNKEELNSRAQELNIEVPENITEIEIENLIKIEEHPIINKALKSERNLVLSLKKELKSERNLVLSLKKELKKAGKSTLSLKKELKKAGKSTLSIKDGEKYESNNGENYEFTVDNFRFKGEKYETSEAVKNEGLMEILVETNFKNLIKTT